MNANIQNKLSAFIIVLVTLFFIFYVYNQIAKTNYTEEFNKSDFASKLFQIRTELQLCGTGEYGENSTKTCTDRSEQLTSYQKALESTKEKFETCIKESKKATRNQCYKNDLNQ